MNKENKGNFGKWILVFLILVVFLIPFSYQRGSVNKSEAFIGGFFDALLTAKELTLDGIAFGLLNIIIEELADDTVRWINGETGDEGPKYVRDLDGFLLEIGDKTVADYIRGTDFGFVCDPFKLQLKVSLARARVPEHRAQCTLSEIVDNVTDFVGGNFYDGGWDAWGEIVTRSNPYLNYLQAENELQLRINANRDRELRDLSFGNGFLSIRKCEGEVYQCVVEGKVVDRNEEACLNPNPEDVFVGNFDPGSDSLPFQAGVWECVGGKKTITPGSVIEDQLNNVLGSGLDKIEAADEINEVITALVSKLLRNVFSDDKGLFSATGEPGTFVGSANHCSDGKDNDRDGLIDRNDPGCRISPNNNEASDTNTGILDTCRRYGIPIEECATGNTPEEVCAIHNIPEAECIPGTTVEVCRQREGLPDDEQEEDGRSLDYGYTGFSTFIPTDLPTESPEEERDDGLICTLVDIPNPGGDDDSDRGNNDDGGGILLPGNGNDTLNPPKLKNNLSNVVWIDKDISGWAETQKLKSVTFTGPSSFNFDYNANAWPGIQDPQKPQLLNANLWVFVYRKGNWYAGTFEFFRPGMTEQFTDHLFKTSGQAHVIGRDCGSCSQELSNFSPQPGEKYYFMVSGLARGYPGVNVSERTNPVEVIWPGTSSSGGGGGSFGFTGDNPSPNAPTTLNNVNWLDTNVGAWKQTSALNKSGITINEDQVCLDHTKKGIWPDVTNSNGISEGNPWVFASINGRWYAATYAWLRDGQTCKGLDSNPPSKTVKEQLGLHTDQSPLKNWKPRKGELVGFMVSTPARDSARTTNERSNVVFINWPF